MHKKWLVLTLFFLVFSMPAIAQDAGKIPELLKKLQSAGTDTAKANTLSLLCFSYSTHNTDSGILYGNQAMALSKKINYKKGIGDACTNLGWAFYHKGDYKKAEDYLFQGLKYYRLTGDSSFVVKPLNDLGYVYLEQDDYTSSLHNFLKALQLAQAANDKKEEANILYGIGVVYNRQNDYKKAREYFQTALNKNKEINDDLAIAQCLNSLANTYSRAAFYDSAILFYNQAIPIFQKHHDIYREGLAYENIGYAYNQKKEYENALKYLNKSKNNYQQLNSKADVAYALTDAGESYEGLKDYTKALEIYQQGLALSNEMNNTELQQTFYQDLSNVYEETGDHKNALINFKKYTAIKDSVFTKSKADELLRLQTQFETAQKEKQNEILKAQNSLVILERNRGYAFLMATTSSLLLLSVLLIIVYRNRRSKIKTIIILKEQRAEILRMNNILEIRALRAQMDPHFIFNCMASLQSLIWKNKNQEADSYLSKFSRLLRMVLENSEQNTVSLDKELDMLKRYLELESIRLKEKFVYEINVDEDLFTEAIQVPTLIIQPFAENALWHGLMHKETDRRLMINVSVKEEMLICVVEDNGVGRQRAEEKKVLIQHVSKGMKIIEERLRIVREQTQNNETGVVVTDLFTESSEPCGTRVIIRIPLKQSA